MSASCKSRASKKPDTHTSHVPNSLKTTSNTRHDLATIKLKTPWPTVQNTTEGGWGTTSLPPSRLPVRSHTPARSGLYFADECVSTLQAIPPPVRASWHKTSKGPRMLWMHRRVCRHGLCQHVGPYLQVGDQNDDQPHSCTCPQWGLEPDASLPHKRTLSPRACTQFRTETRHRRGVAARSLPQTPPPSIRGVGREQRPLRAPIRPCQAFSKDFLLQNNQQHDSEGQPPWTEREQVLGKLPGCPKASHGGVDPGAQGQEGYAAPARVVPVCASKFRAQLQRFRDPPRLSAQHPRRPATMPPPPPPGSPYP